MTRIAVLRWLGALVIPASLLAASCTRKPDHRVTISPSARSFAVTLRTQELEGLCYAPDSFLFNPMLVLDNFVGVSRWSLAPDEHYETEQLDRLLSAKRQTIGDRIELSVRRDEVMIRPSYFVLSVFPCDAPTRSVGWQGKVYTVVGSADLPTFYPPGYREKRSPAEEKQLESEMMHNDTPAPEPR